MALFPNEEDDIAPCSVPSDVPLSQAALRAQHEVPGFWMNCCTAMVLSETALNPCPEDMASVLALSGL